MHVEDRGGSAQQVVVNRRDLDAIVREAFHHGADLSVGEHQITHEHGAAAHGNKRDPSAEREGWFDRNAVNVNLKIASRQSVLVNATRQASARLAYRGIDLVP